MSNLAWIGGVSLNADAELLVASIDSGSYIQNPDSPATDNVNPYEYAIFSDWYESVLAETELSIVCEKIESYYLTLYTPLGGPVYAAPQQMEITSVFWDLWYDVTISLQQNTIFEGSRSVVILAELSCPNCDSSILGTDTVQVFIDGDDDEIFIDVAGGSLEQHLMSESSGQVPLFLSLPSNFLIDCPSGYYSFITGSCYALLYASTWDAAQTQCASDFGAELSDIVPSLAVVDVADEDLELKLFAAVHGNILLVQFLDDFIVPAGESSETGISAGLGSVDRWKTYFDDDIYRPLTGGHPYICERQGQMTINIADGWRGSIAPQFTPDPLSVTFSNTDWFAPQTTYATANDDEIQEPFLQLTTYEISVDDSSKVDFAWHVQFDSEWMKVLDDDVADVIVTSVLWAVTADPATIFEISLASQPTSAVVLTLALSNTSTVGSDRYQPFELFPQVITFTPEDWMIPQSISVVAGVRTEFSNRSYIGEVDEFGRNNSIFPYRFTIQEPWPDIHTTITYHLDSEDSFYNGSQIQVCNANKNCPLRVVTTVHANNWDL